MQKAEEGGGGQSSLSSSGVENGRRRKRNPKKEERLSPYWEGKKSRDRLHMSHGIFNGGEGDWKIKKGNSWSKKRRRRGRGLLEGKSWFLKRRCKIGRRWGVKLKILMKSWGGGEGVQGGVNGGEFMGEKGC